MAAVKDWSKKAVPGRSGGGGFFLGFDTPLPVPIK